MLRTTVLFVRDLVFAIVIGLGAAFALPAFGQTPEVAYIPPAPPFVMPPYEMLASAWAIGGVTVFLVVLFLRAFLRRWLMPEEPTEVSVLLNRVLALAVGLVCGFVVPGAQMAPGVAGCVLAGIVMAAVGVFGRDVLTSSGRGLGEVLERRRVAAAAPATPVDPPR
jgi:hypothetical protein